MSSSPKVPPPPRGDPSALDGASSSSSATASTAASASTPAASEPVSPLPSSSSLPVVSGGHVTLLTSTLNKHLVCTICSGYFRNPQTVIECMHTFCKVCLYKRFRSGYKSCPTCSTKMEPDPYKAILADRTLQELVDKMFPPDRAAEEAFYAARSIKRKPEFEFSHPPPPKSSRAPSGGPPPGSGFVGGPPPSLSRAPSSTDDELNFQLLPFGAPGAEVRPPDDDSALHLAALAKPFLRTSGRLKVLQVKKYICKKLGAAGGAQLDPKRIEVYCNGECLGDELNLTFLKRTRWVGMNADLTLNYRRRPESAY